VSLGGGVAAAAGDVVFWSHSGRGNPRVGMVTFTGTKLITGTSGIVRFTGSKVGRGTS
jgi:hypothetical protein